MSRWMSGEEPVPKLPAAQDEPLFLHVQLNGQGKGDGTADVKVCSRCYIVLVLMYLFACLFGYLDNLTVWIVDQSIALRLSEFV